MIFTKNGTKVSDYNRFFESLMNDVKAANETNPVNCMGLYEGATTEEKHLGYFLRFDYNGTVYGVAVDDADDAAAVDELAQKAWKNVADEHRCGCDILNIKVDTLETKVGMMESKIYELSAKAYELESRVAMLSMMMGAVDDVGVMVLSDDGDGIVDGVE